MSTDFGFRATTSPGYYFVSYNTEDYDRVAEICRLLNEEGLPIWYDEGIPHDSFWQSVIAERIDNCKEMIIFITRGIFEKGFSRESMEVYTYREYDLASRIYKKKILFVFLDEIIPDRDVPHSLMMWWQEIDPGTRQGLIEFNNEPSITKKNILKALSFYKEEWFRFGDDISYPVFNSVIDHPLLGDEREFVHIRKVGDEKWRRKIVLEKGEQYQVEIVFRNDGKPKYNSSEYRYATIATGTRVSVDVPRWIYHRTEELIVRVNWTDSNQNNRREIIDAVEVFASGEKSLKLSIVVGQSVILSRWEANESIMPSNLFRFSGTFIGLNELNGIIPAGDDYMGYVRFYFNVQE